MHALPSELANGKIRMRAELKLIHRSALSSGCHAPRSTGVVHAWRAAKKKSISIVLSTRRIENLPDSKSCPVVQVCNLSLPFEPG